ncbi:hypothetical protein AW736_15670 [Termitidicoccus mucosus]|uniref:Autotransporter domain-containing protein n=2 Tax=Termitidicoccus mucosus TaxID=1184151 RepID=A0A178IF82_9BACT|nr:hypothetical protein AW736_15670 [Opitutaceae bacterium TSB47]
MQNNSSPLGSTTWFQGNSVETFASHAGAPNAYIGANFNNTTGGAGTISNWLVTPSVMIGNGDTFTFYTRKMAGIDYPDRLELRLSLNGDSTNVGASSTATGDFATLLLSINPSLQSGVYPTAWTQYTVTVSGLAEAVEGRFALRYFVTGAGPSGSNSDYIGIDTVSFVGNTRFWRGDLGSGFDWSASSFSWTGSSTGEADSDWSGGTAIFDSGSGTINLAEDVSVAGLEFRTGPYVVTSTGGHALHMTGSAYINVRDGVAAAIATDIIGADGLTKSGGGELLFSGHVDLASGNLLATGGTLAISGSLGSARGYVANAAGQAASVVLGGTGRWANGSELYVGASGTGALVIAGNGGVTSSFGYVGQTASGAGLVTVSDSGFWKNTSGLLVGDQGRGTVTIIGSGSVSNFMGHIGNTAQGIGAVSVGDTGSWINSSYLYVGSQGRGALELSGSGAVSSRASYLGYGAAASGSAAVGGSGRWSMTEDLYIGYSGAGALTIAESGTVHVGGTTYIGRDASGTGSLALRGGVLETKGLARRQGTADLELNGGAIRALAGGTDFFNNLGDLVLDGSGVDDDSAALTLIVDSGLAITATNNFSVASGTAPSPFRALLKSGGGLLTLSGSSWFDAGGLVVHGGTVALTGTLNDAAGVIGGAAGADGALAVTAQGLWQSASPLKIGDSGAGRLSIADNGKIVAGHLDVGMAATGDGLVTVSGSGLIEAQYLAVGLSGTGGVIIQDQATVRLAGLVTLGAQTGGAGALTLKGGMLETTGLVKGDGTAALFLNGGTIRALADNADFFQNLGGIEISGSGLAATPALAFEVDDGVGVTATNNFTFTNGDPGVPAVALRKTGAGLLALSGSNTLGGGHLVADGGTLALAGVVHGTAVIVASGSDGAAVVNLGGAGSQVSAEAMHVGLAGNGTLNVLDGGIVTSGSTVIGSGPAAAGRVAISGSGAWENTGYFAVGQTGSGALALTEQAVLRADDGIMLGASPGAEGRLELRGGLIATSGFRRGDGTATVILNGGTVRASADSADFFRNLGALTLTGSSLPAGQAALTLDIASGLTVTATNQFASAPDDLSGLAKTGAGKLVLAADNSALPGALDISQGVVQIGAARNLPGGALNGGGTLALDGAGETGGFFTVVQAAGGFNGTVRLQNSSTLGVAALTAPTDEILGRATLQLADGGKLRIDGSGSINGLDLAGGGLEVRRDAASLEFSPHLLTVGSLAGTGSGSTMAVDTALLAGIDTHSALDASVFDLDGTFSKQVVKATHTALAGNIAVTGLDGAALSGSAAMIKTGAVETGLLHYGYTAVASGAFDDSGIWLGYGIAAIEATHDAESVVIDPTGSIDKTLGARLTGTGASGFAFTGGETITLAHLTGNDYTGATRISGSTTVVAGAHHSLGQTSALTIEDGSVFDLDGKFQTAGDLAINAGGRLDLGASGTFVIRGNPAYNGNINLAGTSTVAGHDALAGGADSSLQIGGGAVLRADGANTAFRGNVRLGDSSSPGHAILENLSALGDEGTIQLDGDSWLQFAVSGTFAKSLSGTAGTTVAIGGGRTVLVSGNNSAFGQGAAFTLDGGGTLRARNSDALGTAAVFSADQGTLRLENFNGALANPLEGRVTLQLRDASAITIARANDGFQGAIDIDATSALTLSGSAAAGSAATLANAGLLVLAAAHAVANDSGMIGNTGTTRVIAQDAMAAGASLGNTGHVQIAIPGHATFSHAINNAPSATVELNTAAEEDELVFATALTAGNLVKTGDGVVVLGAAQTHAGLTEIQAGTLRATAANQFSASSEHRVAGGAVLNLGGFGQHLGHLRNDGRVDFVALGQALTVAGLSGHGTYTMDVNLATQEADRIVVTGTATGTHTLLLTALGGAPANPSTLSMGIVAIGAGDATFTANAIDAGMHSYALFQGDPDDPLASDPLTWYLGRSAQSRAADAILLTAGVLSIDWHYSLDSLRLRMGELRSGGIPAVGRGGDTTPTGNVWVRTGAYHLSAGKDAAGAAFDQDTFGVTAGLDRAFGMDAGDFFAGGFIAMGQSSRDHDNHGESTTGSVGAGVYATWLHASGWYADLVARIDRYDNRLDARSDDGQLTRADYSNLLYGFSVEAGRRLRKRHVWLEPSVQAAVAYIDGEDYTAASSSLQTIDVSIRKATAFQYRLQLRGGVDLGAWRPYAKFGTVRSNTDGGEVYAGGGIYAPALDGWRFETGLGASYLIDPSSQVYFDYEYNKAGGYERPWALNLGYRRNW